MLRISIFFSILYRKHILDGSRLWCDWGGQTERLLPLCGDLPGSWQTTCHHCQSWERVRGHNTALVVTMAVFCHCFRYCWCLYFVHRYLFWTEWGQYPRIERSRLDGSQRAILVNVSISWPNGISIDYEVRQYVKFFHTFILMLQVGCQHNVNHYLCVLAGESAVLVWCQDR